MKTSRRKELAARRAREVRAPVAYVNMVGGQDDLVFDGGSFVLDADGDLVARSPQFVEDLLLWDLPGAPGVDDDASSSGTGRAPLPRRIAPPLDPAPTTPDETFPSLPGVNDPLKF